MLIPSLPVFLPRLVPEQLADNSGVWLIAPEAISKVILEWFSLRSL